MTRGGLSVYPSPELIVVTCVLSVVVLNAALKSRVRKLTASSKTASSRINLNEGSLFTGLVLL